jgi:hypothetical protein
LIHVFTPFVSLCKLKYNDCHAEDTEFIGRKEKGFKVLDGDQQKGGECGAMAAERENPANAGLSGNQ